MLDFFDKLIKTLFGPIASVWINITDISETDIGGKIEDIIWVGIILAIVVVLGMALTTPRNLSSDEMVSSKNCENCEYYFFGECQLTNKKIGNSYKTVCSGYKRKN